MQAVESAFAYWSTEEGDRVHAGECIQELLEQVRQHKVNIDGDVCTVMVTTLVLEVSHPDRPVDSLSFLWSL